MGNELVPGATQTTWLYYHSGHYEYMASEADGGRRLVDEGRFEILDDHTILEVLPIPGGATYQR